jgi:hypothetical protein
VALRRVERRETEAFEGTRAEPAVDDAGANAPADAVLDATHQGERPPPNTPVPQYSNAAGAAGAAAGTAANAGEQPGGADAAAPGAVPMAALASGQLDLEEVATHPEHAAGWMAHAVLTFNERIERIGEVAVMILIGALLWSVEFPTQALWFVPLLFFVIRPVSVRLGLAASRTTRTQRRLIGWFGIRGIGSLYYLAFAITHGLQGPEGDLLAGMTLAVIVASVVAHGVSVTPLMKLYERIGQRARTAG